MLRDPRKGRGSDVTEEVEPPTKKSRSIDGTAVGTPVLMSPNMTPTRQSRRLASMTPGTDEVKKKQRRT